MVGAASLHRQDGLQEKMIRLHVIANSDSEDDQTMKLLARDAVLTRAEAILRQASNREEAMEEFLMAMAACEGSEGSRYAKIYSELAAGKAVCTD